MLGTPGVPDGRIIAVAPAAVATAYSGLPLVSKHTSAAIHMEDNSPLMIGTPGTPATVAAPTVSVFQQDSVAVRVRAKESWGVVANGGVQFIGGVSW